jgi:protein TonB
LFQPSSLALPVAEGAATQPRYLRWRENWRDRVGARFVGLALALVAEAIILLLLLSLGNARQGMREERVTEVDLVSHSPSEQRDTPEPQRAPAPQPAAAAPPREQTPTPRPPTLTPAQPAPLTPAIIPLPQDAVIPDAPAAPAVNRPAPRSPPAGPVYGPPDSGASSGSDTARVGTAPNGEPLYAAAWYRRPGDSELSGYLSTASGPGWGLIACKTVPDFRVEDCVGLGEYPEGSHMMRAVLAASWQFRVRPPRKGGVTMVGSWVRIRIDYDLHPR